MKKAPVSLPLLAAFAFLLPGCATMINGTKQDVAITTIPDGAECVVDGARVQTPTRVNLKRGAEYDVRCEKAGYTPAQAHIHSELSGWVWLGGLPGLLIDKSSGGGYNLLPESITVSLLAAGAAPVATPASVAAQATSAVMERMSDVDDVPTNRAAARPHAYALVIGIERYREKLPPATFAARDAKLTAEYLKKVLGYNEENVVLLTDDHASKGDFEKYLERWLPNRVESGDDVFVYYSGHGAPNTKNGDAYLVPFDGDPTYIEQTGYPIKKMYAQLAKLPAKRVYVAMDSCFSGAGGRSVIANGTRPLVTVATAELPDRMTVLAASASDQVSNSYQSKGHGLFTYFFLKGLKANGSDMRAVFDYLKPEVARVARREYNTDQEPQWREGK